MANIQNCNPIVVVRHHSGTAQLMTKENGIFAILRPRLNVR